MKVLFICNQNQDRSKTAEILFKDKFQTKSAGLYNDSPVTKNELLWADLVAVMEEAQRSELAKRFPEECFNKRIIYLDVPDVYHFNQPELVKLLKSRVKKLIQTL